MYVGSSVYFYFLKGEDQDHSQSYSWFCTQRLLLASRGSEVVPRIKVRSATCETCVFLLYYSSDVEILCFNVGSILGRVWLYREAL